MSQASTSRLKKLISYLKPHYRQAGLGVLALFVVNILGVYIPRLISRGIDDLKDANSLNDFTYYAVIIAVLASVMWGIRMASRIWLFGVGRQVEFDLKQEIFNHLLTLEPAYFSSRTVGDLINRATSDIDSIRRLLGFAVLSIANTIFAYALTLPVMLAINVKLTLLAISVYPFMLILVQLFSDKLRSQQLEVQEELSTLTDLIQEDMSGMSLIKIYSQEDNEKLAFHGHNKQLLKANLGLSKTRNTIFPVLGGLASLSLLILLAAGGGLLESGELTVGNFVALTIYVERLVFPTALLGVTITTYQRGEVSIDRLEEILKVQPQVKDTASFSLRSPVQGWLVARDLTYAYAGAKEAALDHVSFAIKPGETVAIVGPIGAGKSTLANSIPRLLDIDIDQLFLDGYDVTQVNLNELRRAIAYVPQESFLFSTSIRNNIAYGDPTKTDAEIEVVAKQAQIYQEILNFPQQYDTLVGERGITLSGGQRQRMSLARALLIDAPILILDDALSSVDNQTATNILNNLSSERKKKTVIFISHQMSAAATADRILVMERGRIVQTGTHQELLEQVGLYQELWNQQKLEEILK